MTQEEIIQTMQEREQAGAAKNLALFFMLASSNQEIHQNMDQEPGMLCMLTIMLDGSQGDLDESEQKELIDLMAEKAAEKYPETLSKFYLFAAAHREIRETIEPQAAIDLYILLDLLEEALKLKSGK